MGAKSETSPLPHAAGAARRGRRRHSTQYFIYFRRRRRHSFYAVAHHEVCFHFCKSGYLQAKHLGKTPKEKNPLRGPPQEPPFPLPILARRFPSVRHKRPHTFL